MQQPIDLDNMQQPIDLSGLKDVIVPHAPSIFPLALGWWFVIGILYVAIVLALYIWMRRYFSPKAYALRELKNINEQMLSTTVFAKEVSKLLKRICILKYGSQTVAKLNSTRWSAFLVQHGQNILTQNDANFIAFSTYLPENIKKDVDKETLYKAVQLLIKNIFKGK